MIIFNLTRNLVHNNMNIVWVVEKLQIAVDGRQPDSTFSNENEIKQPLQRSID